MVNGQRLAPTIRINELSDNQRIIGYTVGLGHGERVTLHGLDRSPHVDDLHTGLE